MITDIPTPAEFQTAGLNQLYLAWQIALQALEDYEGASEVVDTEDQEAAARDYWARSQPALANAFGLAQQAMEMALRGRIAAVSPFLLISRDPKEWPKGVDTGAIPFSDFRTLEAIDLVKVHNVFAAVPLDVRFVEFWNEVRRDRNRIMHSVSRRSIEAADLVRTVLTAAQALFADASWPGHLLVMEAEGKYAAYGLDDGTQNVVMRQVDTAMRHLTPAEARTFFRFDVGRRAYLCPVCHSAANRDWQDDFPRLAQLEGRGQGATTLRCVVCETDTPVIRSECANADCPADVIHDGLCLTCLRRQDDPDLFAPHVRDDAYGEEPRYAFNFGHGLCGRGGETRGDTRSLPDDEAAREHARHAMLEPRLSGWDWVAVREETRRRLPFEGLGRPRRLLGAWVREGEALTWRADWAPDDLPLL